MAGLAGTVSPGAAPPPSGPAVRRDTEESRTHGRRVPDDRPVAAGRPQKGLALTESALDPRLDAWGDLRAQRHAHAGLCHGFARSPDLAASPEPPPHLRRRQDSPSPLAPTLHPHLAPVRDFSP